jgi:hypothetical protein
MRTVSLLLLATGSLLFMALNHAREYTNTTSDEFSFTAKLARPQLRESSRLFPVPMKNRMGFIDSLGTVILPPVYESANEFSEGLSAVRINGLYGFINSGGDVIIPNQFDYATQFNEGLALVFRGNQPLFITKQGTEAFNSVYAGMSSMHNGRAHVWTASNKTGVIDDKGRLIVDTVFQYIGEFSNGFAVAEGIGHNPYGSEESKMNLRITIIDSLGHMIVPFGKFFEISGPYEGYFTAALAGKNEGDVAGEVILNRNGQIVYRFSKREYSYSSGVSNGIFRITRQKNRVNPNSETYDAYITPDGKTVYENKQAQFCENFRENFAFGRYRSNKRFFINRKGKVIGEYDDLKGEGFTDGLALAQKDDLWGVIDTTGRFVMKPKFDEVQGLAGNYVVFEDPDYEFVDSAYVKPTYGLADLTEKIIIPPTFHELDPRGFVSGLLKTWVGGRIIFFNMRGERVWQEDEVKPRQVHARNIDHMQRGYFYASSHSTGHPGRWGAEPEKIPLLNNLPASALSVTVLQEEETVVEGELPGMRVLVANNTDDTLIFNAQDNRLYMKMQALTSANTWQDIEYLPNSWCGNSYHSIALPNKHLWKLSALVYEGSVPTKLRIELAYLDPADTLAQNIEGKKGRRYYRDKRELKIYSNEFYGTINPGQLWRQEVYHPSGIMDPYNQ